MKMCRSATINSDRTTTTAPFPKNVPLTRPTTPQVDAQGTTQDKAIVMRSRFFNPSLIQHNNLICVLNSVQTVGNHENGFPFHQAV